jgi:hypothetical protein
LINLIELKEEWDSRHRYENWASSH